MVNSVKSGRKIQQKKNGNFVIAHIESVRACVNLVKPYVLLLFSYFDRSVVSCW